MSGTIAHLEMASRQHLSAIEHEYVRHNLSTAPDHEDKGVYLESVEEQTNKVDVDAKEDAVELEERYSTIPYYLELTAESDNAKSETTCTQTPPAPGLRSVTVIMISLAAVLLLAFLTAILTLSAEVFVNLNMRKENLKVSKLIASNQPEPLTLSTTTETSKTIKDSNLVNVVSLNLPTTAETMSASHASSVAHDNATCLIHLRASGGNDNTTQYCSININGVSYLDAVPQSVYSNPVHSRGVNTLELDHRTCTGSGLNNFDTFGTSGSATKLSNYITSLDLGTVLVGVSCDEPMSVLGDALETLNSVGVSVDDVNFRGKFAFALMKGFPLKTILAKAMAGGSGILLNVLLQDSEMTRV